MGDGQIGYDLDPHAALQSAKSIAEGMEEYLKNLEKNRKEICNRLDSFYEELKPVWKLTDDDEWLKSVKEEFGEMKQLLKG